MMLRAIIIIILILIFSSLSSDENRLDINSIDPIQIKEIDIPDLLSTNPDCMEPPSGSSPLDYTVLFIQSIISDVAMFPFIEEPDTDTIPESGYQNVIVYNRQIINNEELLQQPSNNLGDTIIVQILMHQFQSSIKKIR